MDTTRRDLIRIAAAAVAAGPLAAQTAVTPALKFFTAHEYELADELTDIIIPTDEHSPSAKTAKVAAFSMAASRRVSKTIHARCGETV